MNADNRTSLFELVDATGDEYYTLGIYFDPESAIADATHGDHPPTECEDTAILEVRERKAGFTGWGDNGVVVATIEWSESYDEAADEYKWSKPKVTRKD